MSRARGKHDHTRPVSVDTPEGHDIGASDRMQGEPSPIPGGLNHLTNRQTMRQQAPTPAPRPEYHGVMAHGVEPGSATTRERAELERGPNVTHDPQPRYEPVDKASKIPPPVPVVIVEAANDREVLRSSSHRAYLLPSNTGDPLRLVGRNAHRTHVLLLNEDAAHAARFGQRPGDVLGGTGTFLPAAMTSYLKLETQDELWGLAADTGTPKVSIIEIFTQSNTEVP